MKNWIGADKEHLGGVPRVKGTRISISFFPESFASGMSIQEIVDAYRTLTEESIRGVLAQLAEEKKRRENSPAQEFQHIFVRKFMSALRKTNWGKRVHFDSWPN